MHRRHWTADEIKLLTHRYPKEGISDLPSRLARSEDSITSLARRLGLRSSDHHQNQALARAGKKEHRV